MQACTCSLEQEACRPNQPISALKPMRLLGKLAAHRGSAPASHRRFTSNLSFAISIPTICVAGFIVCLRSIKRLRDRLDDEACIGSHAVTGGGIRIRSHL